MPDSGNKINHRYLSRGDLKKRLKTEVSKSQNLAKKLERMKAKLEKEAVSLNENNNQDMHKMLDYANLSGAFKGDENMRFLWECQKDALNSTDPRQHRWHPR